MRFTIQGRSHHLTPDDVRQALAGRRPGPVQTHWVAVSGLQWPIKQALEVCTGIYRAEFTTDTARRVFERLGFPVSQPPTEHTPRRPPPPLLRTREFDEHTERAWRQLTHLLHSPSLNVALEDLERSLVGAEQSTVGELVHRPEVGGALIEYAMLARRQTDRLLRVSEATAVLLGIRAMLQPGERVVEPPTITSRAHAGFDLRTTVRNAQFVLGPLTKDNTVRQRRAVSSLVMLMLDGADRLAQLWVSDARFPAFLSTCEQTVGWGLSRSPMALREAFEDVHHTLEMPVHELVNGPAADVEIRDLTELVPEAAAIG